MRKHSTRLAAIATMLLGLYACGGVAEEELVAESKIALNKDELILSVRETEGIARRGEVVRSGVPLPKALAVKSTANLAVIDAAGTPVSAEFTVLARWNAARGDTNAAIQWLLVTFPATVPADGTSKFRLVVDGSARNPAPADPLVLTRSGDRITVDTGAATFVVDADAQSLFDEIRVADGTQVGGRSTIDGTVDARSVRHTSKRKVTIESQGPLAAIVVVEGAYDFPTIGGGGLGSRRRYVFTAGSPTAIVRHSVAYEGDRCLEVSGAGAKSCGGQPNGVLVTKLRDAISLNLSATRTVQALGAKSASPAQSSIGTGQEASVRQKLRGSRLSPRSFQVSVPSATQSGEGADGAMLAVTGGGRTVAIAMDHMNAYEPQALRLLSDGRLAIDLADDKVWLGARQGTFATFAVSAIAGTPSRADLDRVTWAPLNAPLRAWPTARMFAHSKAAGEIATGTLPTDLAGYDALVKRVLDDTKTMRAQQGLFGLSTFGAVPREWGKWNNEVDCGEDPTPGDDWDDAYWCGTWTDYHNGMNTAAIRAMRTGEVEYLDDLQEPAALRMLHTQIMQCAPGDTYFYCGQAPAGYGGFRADFNSSHAYFENMMTYYWLTGDRTVVDTVMRGASSMRNYLCTKRPGATCTATDLPTDPWAQLSGRVGSQWFLAFRFIGLASDDPSYLDDYRQGLARSVTQHYVEGLKDGKAYGFWTGPSEPVSGAGRYTTEQLWMGSLYDMTNLYRLQIDTEDAAIGSPAVQPSRVIARWARTLAGYGATVSGNGTAEGTWANALSFSTSGTKLDGALVSVAAATGGSDPQLYDTGKANLVAVLVRAGQTLGDSTLTSLGRKLTQMTIAGAMADGTPMSKRQALFLSQLHAAVARLTPDAPAPTSITAVTSVTLTEEAQAEQQATEEPAPAPAPTAPSYTGTMLMSTLDSFSAITSPASGPAGTYVGLYSSDFVAGQVGSGVSFTRNGARVSFGYDRASLADALKAGEIELWYKPSYASNAPDDRSHAIVVIGDIYNPPALIIDESDSLGVAVIDSSWQRQRAATDWRAPTFAAGQWVQIKATWDSAASGDAIKLYVNGQRVDRGGARGGWNIGDGPKLPAVTVGAADAVGSYTASGVIDQLSLRAQ
jgi:hypothetical protein